MQTTTVHAAAMQTMLPTPATHAMQTHLTQAIPKMQTHQTPKMQTRTTRKIADNPLVFTHERKGIFAFFLIDKNEKAKKRTNLVTTKSNQRTRMQ